METMDNLLSKPSMHGCMHHFQQGVYSIGFKKKRFQAECYSTLKNEDDDKTARDVEGFK